MVGRQLLHYRVERRLGQGAMGDVYLAEDTRLGRKVALKILAAHLAADGAFLERFTREAKAVAALNHPSIVTLHALEEDSGVRFLTMEYVRGETLDGVVRRDGARPELAREIGVELADALDYAHEQGITHRDLKPSNIMLSTDGRVKILDFGLAKLHPLAGSEVSDEAPTELLTQTGSLIGTVRYMSPEQAQALPADSRSDIFALGVILYELATGRHPFPGSGPAGQLAAILRDRPVRPAEVEAGVDPRLDRTISRCLEKNPRRRYQLAREIVAALESGNGAAGEVAPAAPGEAAGVRSIAVLPFSDLSPGGDQAYFCDGMAEELIHGLTRIPRLRVASRTSAFRFRGVDRDVREIGAALGVGSVLAGSVRKAGRRLRVTVQLAATDSGYQLWSDRFDCEEENVFAVQDGIARRVVGALELELAGDGEDSVVRPQTADLEAYDCYLKGRHHWSRRTEDSLRRSIEQFQRAIDRDPSYARAWAGVADAYAILGLYGSQPPQLVMPRARAAANRALALEPDLAEAHVSLGNVLSLYDWDWSSAAASFGRALELDPDYATAHQWYAINHLVPLGRFEEAYEHAREARRLDPLAPPVSVSVGLVSYFSRRFDEAVRELQQVVDLEPGFGAGHLFLGRALVEVEELEQAVAALERGLELSGHSAEMVAALGHARARQGSTTEAERLLGELATRARRGYLAPSLPAQIHAGLGETERAVECLQQALGERATDLAWLAVRPVFDGLLEDPRVLKLLRRMGLSA